MRETKLKAYFPMLKTREELMEIITKSEALTQTFNSWKEERQEEFLDFCSGARGVKMLYDAFAKELFKFNFVNGVFFASNFVTITKTDDAEWSDIEALLKEFVKGAVESELAVKPIEHSEDVVFEGSDVEVKIQQVLHDYVRPAVEQDGGAIAYKSFEDGKVTVELRGSCSGCPSSTITLKAMGEGVATVYVKVGNDTIAIEVTVPKEVTQAIR